MSITTNHQCYDVQHTHLEGEVFLECVDVFLVHVWCGLSVDTNVVLLFVGCLQQFFEGIQHIEVVHKDFDSSHGGVGHPACQH